MNGRFYNIRDKFLKLDASLKINYFKVDFNTIRAIVVLTLHSYIHLHTVIPYELYDGLCAKLLRGNKALVPVPSDWLFVGTYSPLTLARVQIARSTGNYNWFFYIFDIVFYNQKCICASFLWLLRLVLMLVLLIYQYGN